MAVILIRPPSTSTTQRPPDSRKTTPAAAKTKTTQDLTPSSPSHPTTMDNSKSRLEQHQHQHQRVYDPNVIAKSALERWSQDGDLEGAKLVYQAALLEWVDDARELTASAERTDDEQSLRESIATLWLSYAQFLAHARQFSSVWEVFEQAVTCSVAASVGRLWQEYARYAIERNKLRTAQQVYLRALFSTLPSHANTVVGLSPSGNWHGSHTSRSSEAHSADIALVSDEQDREMLWQDFLEFAQQYGGGNPDLTLDELQAEAARWVQSSEHGNIQVRPDAATSSVLLPLKEEPVEEDGYKKVDEADFPAPKRIKIEDPPAPPAPKYTITREAVRIETTAFLGLLQHQATASEDSLASVRIQYDIQAAWMVMDGSGGPSPPEPPLFDAKPPKLTDPTGRELLGSTKLALRLIQIILGDNGTPNAKRILGNSILQACAALWQLAAIKEKRAATAMEALDKKITAEYNALEKTLESRLTAACNGASGELSTVTAAVMSMNQHERDAFRTRVNQQRQTLLTKWAWEFRYLLYVQQVALTQLGIPTFSGPTADASARAQQARVCQFLHSAFFLRERIGEAPHVKMLESQAAKLQNELFTGQRKKEAMATLEDVSSKSGGRLSNMTRTNHTIGPPNSSLPHHPLSPVSMQNVKSETVAVSDASSEGNVNRYNSSNVEFSTALPVPSGRLGYSGAPAFHAPTSFQSSMPMQHDMSQMYHQNVAFALPPPPQRMPVFPSQQPFAPMPMDQQYAPASHLPPPPPPQGFAPPPPPPMHHGSSNSPHPYYNM